MQLSDRDRAMLNGDLGEGFKIAIQLVVTMAEIQDAPTLVDITSAHIDGCLYHGRASLDFALRLAESGAQVAVPTTLNVSSMDLLHPELVSIEGVAARESRMLMQAYETMGCRPTWTCAPYQSSQRPAVGDQIAWGESNAIVFANSVLGARTERYGDFIDIACALTGRAPMTGFHTDEARRARVVFELDVPDRMLADPVLYPLVGADVGVRTGTLVPAIVGLPESADEDDLKALGAAAASTGAVGLFHAVGITPEAPTLDEALGGESPTRVFTIRPSELIEAAAVLGTDAGGGDRGRLGAVSIGTPHFSASEFDQLASLIRGRRSLVPFLINTSREVLADIEQQGLLDLLATFGATIVTDTCAYLAPVLGDVAGVVMTNSAKAAFYGPANVGWEVRFASLADCVESAVAGEVRLSGMLSA